MIKKILFLISTLHDRSRRHRPMARPYFCLPDVDLAGTGNHRRGAQRGAGCVSGRARSCTDGCRRTGLDPRHLPHQNARLQVACPELPGHAVQRRSMHDDDRRAPGVVVPSGGAGHVGHFIGRTRRAGHGGPWCGIDDGAWPDRLQPFPDRQRRCQFVWHRCDLYIELCLRGCIHHAHMRQAIKRIVCIAGRPALWPKPWPSGRQP